MKKLNVMSVCIFLTQFFAFAANGGDSDALKWFEKTANLQPGNYTVDSSSSDESCRPTGRVSYVKDNGAISVLFDRETIAFGIAPSLYKTRGLVKGCETQVRSDSIANGLLIVQSLKCKADKKDVSRQKLLWTKNGFEIENEHKNMAGQWKKGTNCTYQIQAKK